MLPKIRGRAIRSLVELLAKAGRPGERTLAPEPEPIRVGAEEPTSFLGRRSG